MNRVDSKTQETQEVVKNVQEVIYTVPGVFRRRPGLLGFMRRIALLNVFMRRQ